MPHVIYSIPGVPLSHSPLILINYYCSCNVYIYMYLHSYVILRFGSELMCTIMIKKEYKLSFRYRLVFVIQWLLSEHWLAADFVLPEALLELGDFTPHTDHLLLGKGSLTS